VWLALALIALALIALANTSSAPEPSWHRNQRAKRHAARTLLHLGTAQPGAAKRAVELLQQHHGHRSFCQMGWRWGGSWYDQQQRRDTWRGERGSSSRSASRQRKRSQNGQDGDYGGGSGSLYVCVT
jgi:hypothetical protein